MVLAQHEWEDKKRCNSEGNLTDAERRCAAWCSSFGMSGTGAPATLLQAGDSGIAAKYHHSGPVTVVVAALSPLIPTRLVQLSEEAISLVEELKRNIIVVYGKSYVFIAVTDQVKEAYVKLDAGYMYTKIL